MQLVFFFFIALVFLFINLRLSKTLFTPFWDVLQFFPPLFHYSMFILKHTLHLNLEKEKTFLDSLFFFFFFLEAPP